MAKKKLAKRSTKTAKKSPRRKSTAKGYSRGESKPESGRNLCSQPPLVPMRALDPTLDPVRLEAVRPNAHKWVNGTKLHYYFFDQQSDGQQVVLRDGTRQWRSWVGTTSQMDVVREAFDVWKGTGLGLEFEEVDDRTEAEVRIGFMPGDGAWSYLGRQVLQVGANKRTMNFGWDITNDLDTAVHEIGHTIGLSHEHQNPKAGIDWDEEAVYRDLAGAPNFWDRDKTYHNIIRKIDPDTVQGSSWDPDSIMHYPFRAALIDAPEPYASSGVTPPGGLSDRDKAWALTFYPTLNPPRDPFLVPFESQRLSLSEGEQANFVIEPDATRNYNLQTFGDSDTVMVLFEDIDGDLRYVAGDDDSGLDYNAKLRLHLRKGRRYVLRVRLYWSAAVGETAVLLW